MKGLSSEREARTHTGTVKSYGSARRKQAQQRPAVAFCFPPANPWRRQEQIDKGGAVSTAKCVARPLRKKSTPCSSCTAPLFWCIGTERACNGHADPQESAKATHQKEFRGRQQLYTTKALLVVNLHLDGDSVAQLFAPDRVAETFLTALAWSQLPQVADELRFFAYRLEALAFIYHLYSFSQGQGDLRAVARDVQLISDLSTSVCSKAEGPRAHENPFPLTSACADVSLAVASYADSYTKVLNGRGAPRVHVSPVGDAYYLKRFISPPDMPNVYLPHSRQTLEGSAEQQRLKRFLTRCLESLFTTKRLRYPSAERRRSVAADLEAARKALKKDFLLHQSQH
ncbi:uncharacterized protein LOC34624290 [Cyclospora cayetanensis]|uniref:Uncharacterized protein LOC34624290 n=1 Tax=Cyclospora cayetanensis TaxID=88456 RepID=A0A6P6RXQ7_9EIME|nr:uncharacterized protein LOC34624290 [Cyclospora cayetanensis]